MAISPERPVFVVGPSRSGTSLVRSALNRHPSVHLAGETHYFDDLRTKVSPAHGELDAETERRCEDYFLALAHRPYGHEGDPGASALERAQLRAAAAELGGGADAYFEAFCILQAREHGADRWGEKTPRHVFRIGDILQRYPTAQVVCLVRDPRAVVASYRDWTNQGGFDTAADPGHLQALRRERVRTSRSYHPLVSSLVWRSAVNAAHAARRELGSDRVWIQRYEDLVTDFEPSIHRLTRWLDLDFVEEMADVPVHNSSVAAFDMHGGVSDEPLQRWRKRLSEAEIAIIQSACREAMHRDGYELAPVEPRRRALLGSWASLPPAAVRATITNRSRTGSLPAYVLRRVRLALKTA